MASGMDIKIAVLCDYAMVSDQGKLNILGIFTDIATQAFPAVLPPIFLVASWEARAGEFGKKKTLGVVFLDAEGHQLGNMEQEVAIPAQPPIPGRPVTLNQIVRLEGLVVPKDGDYAFALQIGGETKAEIPLHVQLLKGA